MKKRILFGLILLTTLSLALFTRQQSFAQAENTRVITAHVDGSTKTVATNASTVKDALDRLGIALSQNDKTEPSVNQQIEGNEYTINVYRARPISVVDGASTLR